MSFSQADWRRDRRAQLKAAGICSKCWQRPALIGRVQCTQCQMHSVIRENFKFDRKRNRNGATKARGTCYVEQFAPAVRRSWIDQIVTKWTGKCHLDHMLPVSRASVFGPSKVYHPDNLVWCHKSINLLKGDRTADEFAHWLRHDLPAAIAAASS
jgi:5-methylcytosine-specific restriction endonuclease McrA